MIDVYLYSFDQVDVELTRFYYHQLETAHYSGKYVSVMMRNHWLTVVYVHLHLHRYSVRQINHIYLY